MVKYSLTSSKQKLICLIILIIFGVTNLLSFSLFPKSGYIQAAFLLLSIMISIIYFYLIFFSKIIINRKQKTIIVKLLNKTEISLEGVKKITLEERFMQNKAILVIVLYNQNNEIVNIVNTFFTKKQKEQAEKILSACQELID